MDGTLIPLLTEIGLKPTEVLLFALLYQNVQKTRALLNELVNRVNQLEEISPIDS